MSRQTRWVNSAGETASMAVWVIQADRVANDTKLCRQHHTKSPENYCKPKSPPKNISLWWLKNDENWLLKEQVLCEEHQAASHQTMQHNCEVWLVLISPSWAVLTTLFQTAPALDVRCLSNFIASDFEFDDVLGVPKRKVNMGVNSQSSASKLPVTFPMKWNYESALSRCELTKWKAICWRSELLPYQEFLICRGSHQDLKRWVLNSMQPQSQTTSEWFSCS